MLGALKFTNFTILHPNKPYQFLNNFSSSSSATTIAESTAIVRLNYSAGLLRRTTLYAPAANRQISLPIVGGHKCCHFSSDSRDRGRESRFFCNSKANFDTKMFATGNGKIDNQSDVSPPRNHLEKSPVQTQKLLTLPTILTIGRVAAVPLFVCTFYSESWWGPAATTAIFIAAAFTDWLDGYLARKMNLRTPFGAFLDPVADKLMVAATLILLCTRPFEAVMFGQAPWLLTLPAIAIIGREITMSAVREWAASMDRKLLEAVAVNNLGKWKTATQMSALTILLATRDVSLVGSQTLAYSGVVLLYISAGLALWSLVVYMKKIWKVLLR
ncbi:CDP-alcohol phosphatidyltransferase/Phosphatidylglycerol-phosphate synthase [Handroanthus impetiginosus]|uniref:CDP-diacylglycerol--glycerol-3-phosphate 1-phosphatidyltransferase n=1 Tax=Handroanthus impetiginosus TaxID=429701 RepID=A0A2G9HGV1_9LAMI|nr:CDP-alcohol phosphatidyltransferase/Phosphatidylglycerol-phosphate synthase [Handroanthus impetiginosus]